MRSRIPLISVLSVFLAACSHIPQYKALPTDAKPLLASLEVVLVFPQTELASSIEISRMASGTGGGALFALFDEAINASRQHDAEEAISSVRRSTGKLTLAENALDLYTNQFVHSELQPATFRVIETASQDAIDKALQASTADAVMFVYFHYELSPDFRSFRLLSTSILYPKSEALQSMQYQIYRTTSKIFDPKLSRSAIPRNSLYRNQAHFYTSLPRNIRSKDALIKHWQEQDGVRIKQSFGLGVQAIAKLTELDLGKKAPRFFAKEPQPRTVIEPFKIHIEKHAIASRRQSSGTLIAEIEVDKIEAQD